MINNEEFLNKFFIDRHEIIEQNIQKEYHERIKKIKEEDNDERNNKKMAIISELYYKQGVIDGINFVLNNMTKK